ncbi:unnamed protein product [Protopolystoma xenopodis]|uniref:Uncharacterized protein n=1 Tax=Protopolystoma xenopodis TaxID=117903 RepID=A0A3S5B7L0_9PLAT|nr:unnamed protein product [Protopolystoma xenopodis]
MLYRFLNPEPISKQILDVAKALEQCQDLASRLEEELNVLNRRLVPGDSDSPDLIPESLVVFENSPSLSASSPE